MWHSQVEPTVPALDDGLSAMAAERLLWLCLLSNQQIATSARDPLRMVANAISQLPTRLPTGSFLQRWHVRHHHLSKCTCPLARPIRCPIASIASIIVGGPHTYTSAFSFSAGSACRIIASSIRARRPPQLSRVHMNCTPAVGGPSAPTDRH
jgi:hypothetical protein